MIPNFPRRNTRRPLLRITRVINTLNRRQTTRLLRRLTLHVSKLAPNINHNTTTNSQLHNDIRRHQIFRRYRVHNRGHFFINITLFSNRHRNLLSVTTCVTRHNVRNITLLLTVIVTNIRQRTSHIRPGRQPNSRSQHNTGTIRRALFNQALQYNGQHQHNNHITIFSRHNKRHLRRNLRHYFHIQTITTSFSFLLLTSHRTRRPSRTITKYQFTKRVRLQFTLRALHNLPGRHHQTDIRAATVNSSGVPIGLSPTSLSFAHRTVNRSARSIRRQITSLSQFRNS